MRLALTVQVLRTRGPQGPSGIEDIESAAVGVASSTALPALSFTLRAKATKKAPVLK